MWRLTATVTKICRLAYQLQVPVVFPLTRRDLGFAIGLSGGVTAVALLDVHGEDELFCSMMNRTLELKGAFYSRPHVEARKLNCVLASLMSLPSLCSPSVTV
jgi:hypothetical protein